MSLLQEIRSRFRPVLGQIGGSPDTESLLNMIRPSQDARFGDYQVNCAMPLQKRLGKPPREIARGLVDRVSLDDLCSRVEIAGPGFVNLTVADEVLKARLHDALADRRLGVPAVENPLTVVIDYSSPNVAKPMHVGHIRSTVIGDALARILRFAGHRVITDNHLGDWGTQFGMIIYGYRHFVDSDAYRRGPVTELGRLYRQVRRLIDYQSAARELPAERRSLEQNREQLDAVLARQADQPDKAAAKKTKKETGALKNRIREQQEKIASLQTLVAGVEADPELAAFAKKHPDIEKAVLEETARLHAGDQDNISLWHEFLPHCREDIARIYDRLDVRFDHELGESFYHSMLQDVVDSLSEKGLVTKSDGALCVFMEEFETPMIIRKSDGAFLYATSDLATIRYREEQWDPDVVLYVVDHRQHEHFEKLFAAARRWGYDDTEFHHVSFGTILDQDKKPYRTRSGDTVGLVGLLDEAVDRAMAVVSENDDGKPGGSELSAEARDQIAETVGIGALKYADLSQNRTSDYVFDYDRMTALRGNTATYLQYSYARVQGIFRKLETDAASLREDPVEFQFADPVERSLGLKLVQFGEAVDEVQSEFKPNLLANYLYELTDTFFTFYDRCPIKDAETAEVRRSRLQFCDLVARTISLGLELLGIKTVDRM